MKVLIKGTLIGGLIAFVWVNLSWMVLPWHFNTISYFSNEAPVASALKSGARQDGVYLIPWTQEKTKEAMEQHKQKMAKGPYAFMVVRPNGFELNHPKMMGFGLLLNFVVAFILTYLLGKTNNLSYLQKAGFVTLGATAGVLIAVVPNMVWWQFPLAYSSLIIADAVIAWGLAGLVMAKVIKT